MKIECKYCNVLVEEKDGRCPKCGAPLSKPGHKTTKKNTLSAYLAVFLLVCLVFDGILLCFFAEKEWWSNWMITGPNLYMVLGAFFCHLMVKNTKEHPGKLTWLYVYKGIKFTLTAIAVVLYYVFVKESSNHFVIVTTAAYLVALVVETFVYTHYLKHNNPNKESKE